MMQATVPAEPSLTPQAALSSLARSRTPVVRALRTGGPAYPARQDDVRSAVTNAFPAELLTDSMLAVFDNAQIDERRFARPLDWYLEPRTFAEKNAVYVEEALALSESLATDALADAGIAASDVDAVVFVSSTGISTPSLDAYLIQRMGIDPSVARLPLWGLGCAGGAAGLARGGDLVKAGYDRVLVVVVEFCSLTFMLGDDDKSNLIGTALFADGGAAVVLGADDGGDGALVRLLHSHSTLLPDSAAMTGWDVTEDGFKLRLSAEIPELMMTGLRPAVDASLELAGWSIADLSALVVHPGGAKVIAGYQYALGVDEQLLDPTRSVLRAHGNMSSPTVLFVLAEVLKGRPHGSGLISATGPGFSAEHLLVEFP